MALKIVETVANRDCDFAKIKVGTPMYAVKDEKTGRYFYAIYETKEAAENIISKIKTPTNSFRDAAAWKNSTKYSSFSSKETYRKYLRDTEEANQFKNSNTVMISLF